MMSTNKWTLVVRRNRRRQKQYNEIYIKEEQELNEEDNRLNTAITKYGKEWVEVQRKIQLKNIDLLAKLIDLRFGWGFNLLIDSL